MIIFYCDFTKMPPEIKAEQVLQADAKRIYITQTITHPRFSAGEHGYYETEQEALEAGIDAMIEQRKKLHTGIREFQDRLNALSDDEMIETGIVKPENMFEIPNAQMRLTQKLVEVLPENYMTLVMDYVEDNWERYKDAESKAVPQLIQDISRGNIPAHEAKFWGDVYAFLTNKPMPPNSQLIKEGSDPKKQSTPVRQLPAIKTEWVCNECNAVHGVKNTTEQDIADGLVSCIDCGCSEFHVVPSIPNDNGK